LTRARACNHGLGNDELTITGVKQILMRLVQPPVMFCVALADAHGSCHGVAQRFHLTDHP
jgi:hypothetical protein